MSEGQSGVAAKEESCKPYSNCCDNHQRSIAPCCDYPGCGNCPIATGLKSLAENGVPLDWTPGSSCERSRSRLVR